MSETSEAPRPLEGYIIVVDDSPDARLLLRDVLTRMGLTVDEAENGQQALALVDQRLPDAMVVDLMMPVMDGFTLIKELRKRREARDVPIIILSSVTHENMSQLPGVVGVLRKTEIKVKELQELVREALAKRKTTQDADAD